MEQEPGQTTKKVGSERWLQDGLSWKKSEEQEFEEVIQNFVSGVQGKCSLFPIPCIALICIVTA